MYSGKKGNTVTSRYALVLSGEIFPGFASEAVWPQLAAYFRMEQQEFARLVACAPCTIKESKDLGKLQRLQTGIAQIVGAQTEICAIDNRPELRVMIEDTPHGPIPRTMVEQRVMSGQWTDSILVAEADSDSWRTYSEYESLISPARATPLPPIPMPMPTHMSAPTDMDAPMSMFMSMLMPAAVHDDDGGHSRANDTRIKWLESGTVNAGFWRRCAAYVLDNLIFGLIVAIPLILANMLVVSLGDLFLAAPAVALLLLGVGFWYFPWQESSKAQATFGKRLLGIKVVDRDGKSVRLGRSVLRHFSMTLVAVILIAIIPMAAIDSSVTAYKRALASIAIRGIFPSWFFMSDTGNGYNPLAVFSLSGLIGTLVPNLIFYLSYMRAGWSRYRQTVYDMLAGAYVVFSEARPGMRPPRQRPSMPRHGWLLNIVFVGLPILVGIGMAVAGIVDSRKLQDGIKTVAAVHDAVMPLKDEIDSRGCRPGTRPVPSALVAQVGVDIVGTRGCSITITFAQSSGDVGGQMIRLTTDGRGNWSCMGTMPDRYLPEPCRANAGH